MRRRFRSSLASGAMRGGARRHASARSGSGSGALTSPSARWSRRSYSASPDTQVASASRAAGASSPSSFSWSSVPPVAPRARTARMLFASAIFPSMPTVTRDRKRNAVLTKLAAGRACRATFSGSATWTSPDSELACTARLLRGSRHLVEVLAGGGHDGRGDRPFDEWGVDEANVAVGPAVLEQVAHGQD